MGLTLCAEKTRKSFLFKRLASPVLETEVEKEPARIRTMTPVSGSEMRKIIAEQKEHANRLSPKIQPPAGLQLKKGRSACSLKQQIRERRQRSWHNFIEDEQEAKSYMDALENNSMLNLAETFTVVGSMIANGNDTCQELKRQGEVVRNANRDVRETEKEIDDTNRRLKGMNSVGGKLANLVWSHKKHFHDDSEDNKFTTLKRSMTAPVLFASYSTSQTKQEWMTEGVKKLGSAMNVLEHQQLEMKHEFEAQDKYLNKLDHNIDHIGNKIIHQTDLIHKIKDQ